MLTKLPQAWDALRNQNKTPSSSVRRVSLGPYEITSRLLIRSANCGSFWPAGALPVPYLFSIPCVLICPSVVFFFIWLLESTPRPVPSIYNIKPWLFSLPLCSLLIITALCFSFLTHRLPGSTQRASFYQPHQLLLVQSATSCPTPAAPTLEMSTKQDYVCMSLCTLAPG